MANLSSDRHREARRIAESLSTVDAVACAAWLAWKHRYQFRLAGGIDCVMPRNRALPRWFNRALAIFRARPQWDVRELSAPGTVTYCIRWLGARRWQTKGRAVFQ